jgi:glycosyltransferase involved in cell wall biosynthesis
VSGGVTVGLPIRNGERYLDEVLGAVRAQVVDRELELLIVDSGSTDRTIEIAESHGARVHRIPPHEFSHGGTRNLIMELARGDHVAFLTDDATPAHEGWLQALLDAFDAAEDVALAWGPQRPRPGAPLPIRSELERWFANWETADGSVNVQRLDRSEAGMAAYRREMWRWQFFSDVNSCVARSAWERVPFRPVPISEDQLIARDMLEAGYAKVFNPRAAVLHSHDYPPLEFFRRYFEEWRGLRETLGIAHPHGLRHGLADVRDSVRADREYLRAADGVSGAGAAVPLARSLRHHTLRVAGAALGSRAERLPAGVRRRLSIEGRETYVPQSR